MSVDPWLRELADVNRERQAEERSRLDERWDRLSGGDLSPEEEAELRALAETSEEAREAFEAFRPLGPEFHAGVVKAIREQGLVPRPLAEEVPKPLPFQRRSATRWAGWSSLTAMAAVLLVMVLRPPAPLPGYSGNLAGGNQSFRGGESTTVGPFVPGTLLTFDATPDRPVKGAVEARGFAACGPDLIQLEKEPAIAKSGNVRLQGEVGTEVGAELRLPQGTCRIWVVVCRPGKLPAADEIRGKLNAGRIQHSGCQAAVSEPFKVRDHA